ncbi:MAG: zf-HC2 domain-containing protein, partial [Acidobacteria bacterium]|nr:zf-HC2 domain-containing protein [Acidobacteriota bacterium]
MTCDESLRAFSLYLDGELPRETCAALDEHLGVCPLCRHQLEQTRLIIRGLSMVSRPATPPDITASINNALSIERAAGRARPALPLPERVMRWLEPHLMPYAVGAFYSAVLFVAVFGALRSQFQVLRNLAAAQRLEAGLPYTVTWVEGEGGGYDVTRPVSPELYAAGRSLYAAESPTLNPRGALAQLAWATPSSGRPDDDDMIVVADVYGNGSASLAAVVEPPRNPRMLDELQDAFRRNPAFVPASLDRRPQT